MHFLLHAISFSPGRNVFTMKDNWALLDKWANINNQYYFCNTCDVPGSLLDPSRTLFWIFTTILQSLYYYLCKEMETRAQEVFAKAILSLYSLHCAVQPLQEFLSCPRRQKCLNFFFIWSSIVFGKSLKFKLSVFIPRMYLMKKWDKGDELVITFKQFLEVLINKDFFFLLWSKSHI